MNRIYLIASNLGLMQEDILDKAKNQGQGHLVDHYNSLKDKDLAENFLNQLKSVDFEETNKLYQDVYIRNKNNVEGEQKMEFTPLNNVSTRADIEKNEAEFDAIGYESISRGEAGVLIMSGGQGSRLGFDHPKGMFNIKAQSNKTLFEVFANRLIRLGQLVKKKHPETKFQENNMIKWYLLTSEINNQEIIDYFKQNKYFGYDPDSMVFFPQGAKPAVYYDGKIIIEDEGKLSLAPIGNGALYSEMKRQGVVKHMREHGVKNVYIAPVDNILLKLGDPTCLGYMIKNNFEIVSTYVKKGYPEEKVGIHVNVNGKVQICEYSQIPKELTELKDEKGELVYCHGNRATLFMSVDFIDRITSDPKVIEKVIRKCHIAEKKIKFYDSETKVSSKPNANNGIKFELFYFDVFDQAEKFGFYEVLREDQFAPVKNAEGNDSPTSARQMLWALHRKWLNKSGIEVEGEGPFEIDPRLCYFGQGIKELVGSKVGQGKVKLPLFIGL